MARDLAILDPEHARCAGERVRIHGRRYRSGSGGLPRDGLVAGWASDPRSQTAMEARMCLQMAVEPRADILIVKPERLIDGVIGIDRLDLSRSVSSPAHSVTKRSKSAWSAGSTAQPAGTTRCWTGRDTAQRGTWSQRSRGPLWPEHVPVSAQRCARRWERPRLQLRPRRPSPPVAQKEFPGPEPPVLADLVDASHDLPDLAAPIRGWVRFIGEPAAKDGIHLAVVPRRARHRTTSSRTGVARSCSVPSSAAGARRPPAPPPHLAERATEAGLDGAGRDPPSTGPTSSSGRSR